MAVRKKVKKGKKLKAMSQTHGMKEPVEPTMLSQIWGDDGTSRYSTMDVDEYTEKIKSMPKSDLHAHATKIGLLPIDRRDLLQKRLVREFKKHVSRYNKPLTGSKMPDDVPNEIRKILEEGK